MNFKKKKIRKNLPKENNEIPKKISRRKISLSVSLLASLIVIFLLFIGITEAVRNINFTVFLKIAGEKLQTDAYNHTNFLVLGTGGKNHEGGDLTDTIIVASLDDENKLLTLVSIPRDMYVKDEIIGNSRINEVYYNAKNYYGSNTEGLNDMKDKVENMMGIPIHYWVKLDFDGFKELIDALGGIDVYVEKSIYDPYYPKDGTFLYEPFSISEGQHHLDGEVALKYARSRKTTSDFDRANRQQQIIYAVKEKALQTEIIFSRDKITEILNTLKSNIETNITVKEILTLGSMAEDYSQDQISHKLIHDDPTQCGGFLYTPAREFYNGMFILLPAGGFEFIHRYSDLNFNLPTIATEKAKIHILNGTGTGGIAGETKQVLKRFCFDIVKFGNAKSSDISETTYYYKQKYDEDGEEIKSRPNALNFLQKLIPGKESTDLPKEYFEKGYLEFADIVIEIGSDYGNSKNYVSDPFYYLPQTKAATPTDDTVTNEDQ
ncbi:MAG: LCP family protein [bacterium]|nr:LCP family protein [bacterium]